MTHTEILAALQPVFRELFERDDLTVTDESSANSIDGWDSFMHINLIAAVEGQFGVRFALGELEELRCVGDMIDLILRKRGS